MSAENFVRRNFVRLFHSIFIIGSIITGGDGENSDENSTTPVHDPKKYNQLNPNPDPVKVKTDENKGMSSKRFKHYNIDSVWHHLMVTTSQHLVKSQKLNIFYALFKI